MNKKKMNKKKSQINFALFLYSIIQLLLLSLCWLLTESGSVMFFILSEPSKWHFGQERGV